jgi:DNA-binding NtrC family response regulator
MRARSAILPASTPAVPFDTEQRFRTLVQSPLRAGLLRFLHSQPEQSFDVPALMAAFGRMRADVDNCVQELVAFGVAGTMPGAPERFQAIRPAHDGLTRLVDQFLELRASISTEDQSPAVQRFREMIGRDEKMLVVFEWIRTAAKSDIAVLILGPTGSGKELVARMIHDLSRRATENFQAVNCAALPDTLFESEIFGYEKGAFTGANDRKPGRLDLADRGTLFLDEIGDLSVVAQAKLLRVLEDRRFERLGGQKPVQVDFRLISATNRPLEQFVRDARFREDLYYRVNAFAIRLPSLRERPSTSPFWPAASWRGSAPAMASRRTARRCRPKPSQPLQQYSWPGNIRELESTVSRAALSAPGRVIRASDIEFLHMHAAQTPSVTPRLPSLRDAERAHIVRVLDATRWNKKEAARVLEISRGTLYRKILEYGLEPANARVS